MQSYSIAYPGLKNSMFLKASIWLRLFNCASSGRLVEKPFIYIWSEFFHSGSKNNRCDGWCENLWTLSSIDGQYLGPTPVISPLYIGERCELVLITSCTLSFVLTVWHGSFFGLKFLVKKENGTGFLSPKSTDVFFQSMLDFSARGGVPVFNLIVLNPIELRYSVIPIEEDSPILPARIFLSPTWIIPDKKVPHVITTALQNNFSPERNTTPSIFPLFITKETTSPTTTSIFLFCEISFETYLS